MFSQNKQQQTESKRSKVFYFWWAANFKFIMLIVNVIIFDTDFVKYGTFNT